MEFNGLYGQPEHMMNITTKRVYERKVSGRFAGAPWVGAVVRLPDRKRTATVLSDNVTIGNARVEGGLFLDRPLSGLRYWNVSDLVMVRPNRHEKRLH